jgi:hypothetical protein
MHTGIEFIQRMQDDLEFRQKVNSCANGPERLAFLKSQGYDFTQFVEIMDRVSSGPRLTGGLPPSGGKADPHKGRSGWLGRLSQIFRPVKSPHPSR